MYSQVERVMPNSKLESGPHKCHLFEKRVLTDHDLSVLYFGNQTTEDHLQAWFANARATFDEADGTYLGIECNIPMPWKCKLIGGFKFTVRPRSLGDCYKTDAGRVVYKDPLTPDVIQVLLLSPHC